MTRQQCNLPVSLWCLSPVNDILDLENIHHVRLLESSAQTVTRVILQAQLHVFMLDDIKALFLHTLTRNLCSRHDFMVYVSVLSVSWPVIANSIFMASRFLCILLRCWEIPILLSSSLPVCSHDHLPIPIGGGRQYLFSNSSIMSSIVQGADHLTPDHVFRFVDHVDDVGRLLYPLGQNFVYANLPLSNIVPFLSKQMTQKIAQIHNIPLSSHWNLKKVSLKTCFIVITVTTVPFTCLFSNLAYLLH